MLQFHGSEKWFFTATVTAANRAAVQCDRPDVKELSSLLCKDFLQDLSLSPSLSLSLAL